MAAKAVALPTVASASTSAGSGAAGAAADKKDDPRDWDLTFTIAPFMDRHMLLPLVEFIHEKKLYPEGDMWQAKLELVAKTKMVDYYVEEYTKFYGKEPNEKSLDVSSGAVIAMLKEGRDACAPLLDLLNDPEAVDVMRKEQRFTAEALHASHAITEDHIRHLYRYAKLSFDCGRYRDAADFLYYFRLLSKDEEKRFLALWGKLAAEILLSDGSDAPRLDLIALRDAIDARKGDHVVQLQQRTWLIHWSLFVFFGGSENGLDKLIEFLFLDQRLLNALQTSCPHVLRYVTCALIINKQRRRNALKDLVRVLGSEKDCYSDPMTDFLRTLLIEFDFESAQKKLKQCETLMNNDFFLSSCTNDLLASGRQLVFETYARTHQCIDIDLLAQRLDIKVDSAIAAAAVAAAKDSKDKAAAAAAAASPADSAAAAAAAASGTSSVELRIVELIRGARVDVKIDAKKNQIVMDSTRHPSIYQQVIDKTDQLTQRTTHLASEIDKRIQQKIDAKNDRD